MITAKFFFSSLYLGICFYLSRGLKKIRKISSDKTAEISLSIIVCARNEEKNIAKLLDCLLLQTYPKNLTQIIVVDDRSSDKTAQIVLPYKEACENLTLIRIKEKQNKIAPKKFAFQKAMQIADGEIILQTDADSIVPCDWIQKSIAPFFNDEKIALSQGIVKYRFDEKISPILKTYQNFDFISHGVVAAAGIGKDVPLNANANNFAFRKIIYESLGGYGKLSKVVGGDDGLIMQRFKQSGKEIFFNADSIVETKPEYSWKNLINQRKKWGSETKFYMPKQFVILGSIFTFYCFVIFTPLLFVVKILGELLFMFRGLSLFGEKRRFLLPHIIWISPLNLFITIYSVFSGFFGKFDWKGEKFKAKK
jgi:cellulose synthase/poly-beta-1,6-N-acetylglucosamine synthase-like glycosyltransferase